MMPRRARNLLKMLSSVSKMGMPKTSMGNPIPTKASALDAVSTEAVAIIKPTNRLPQSPINILAGWKLKNRNPVKAPDRASITTARTTLPCHRASIAITAQAIPDIPAARPSKPSMRLMALVTPTIHRMVTGQANQPK